MPLKSSDLQGQIRSSLDKYLPAPPGAAPKDQSEAFDRLAKAIAEGVVAYFGTTKVKVDPNTHEGTFE